MGAVCGLDVSVNVDVTANLAGVMSQNAVFGSLRRFAVLAHVVSVIGEAS
jgi:hypothetical protein